MPDALRLTQDEYARLKTFLYHTVDKSTQDHMDILRSQGLRLALNILRSGPPSRSQELALTHLEDAMMRAIQTLALSGTPVLPPYFSREAEAR